MSDPGLLALFTEPRDAAAAIRMLRAAGVTDIRVAMPAPFPEIMRALDMKQSGVGPGVFIATVVGVLTGLSLCAFTSLAWPLVVGGKPILAWPAFVVIGFEMSVLIGGSVTHGMLAYTTVVGRVRKGHPCLENRVATDRIGVFVAKEAALAETVLAPLHPEELHHVR